MGHECKHSGKPQDVGLFLGELGARKHVLRTLIYSNHRASVYTFHTSLTMMQSDNINLGDVHTQYLA